MGQICRCNYRPLKSVTDEGNTREAAFVSEQEMLEI